MCGFFDQWHDFRLKFRFSFDLRMVRFHCSRHNAIWNEFATSNSRTGCRHRIFRNLREIPILQILSTLFSPKSSPALVREQSIRRQRRPSEDIVDIKIPPDHHASNPELRDRFEREAKTD